MTEAEWLACHDVEAMVGRLGNIELPAHTLTRRKLALFGYACCQRLHDLLPKKESREAVEMLGLYAEGLADDRDLSAAQLAASQALHGIKHPAKQLAGLAAQNVGHFLQMIDPRLAATGLARFARDARGPAAAQESAVQAGLLRCIFGNVFRPITLAADCRTAEALSIAQAAYGERASPSGHLDSGRLGVLADALEEAGCADANFLSHLRSPGPHVRGCWALDLLLGKH